MEAVKREQIILGGGMVGTLLQRELGSVGVVDSKPHTAITNLNALKGANYLWEPLPGFECKPFKVFTTIEGRVPTEDLIQSYKAKIGRNGEGWSRSFQPYMTGWDFVEAPRPHPVGYFGTRVMSLDLERRHLTLQTPSGVVLVSFQQLFSTIPLCDLAALATKFPYRPQFNYCPINLAIQDNVSGGELCTARVNYLLHPATGPYRQTFRNGAMALESLHPMENSVQLYPGKIWAQERTAEILHYLSAHGVYCFGRFGRWNPKELLHETYAHIRRFVNNDY